MKHSSDQVTEDKERDTFNEESDLRESEVAASIQLKAYDQVKSSGALVRDSDLMVEESIRLDPDLVCSRKCQQAGRSEGF